MANPKLNLAFNPCPNVPGSCTVELGEKQVAAILARYVHTHGVNVSDLEQGKDFNCHVEIRAKPTASPIGDMIKANVTATMTFTPRETGT